MSEEAGLLAEVISINGGICECWLQIADGLRVRTIIPFDISINARQGDEFTWYPDTKITEFKTVQPNSDIEDELDELDRYYNEHLRSLDIGI